MLWKLKKMFRAALILITAGMMVLNLGQSASARPALELFTPYAGVSATPGESIDYEIQVINRGSATQFVTFEMEGLDDGWEYHLTADGRDLHRLAVRPGTEESVSIFLQIDVPLEVKKGTYQLSLVGKASGGEVRLPLSLEVTEEGSARTELTSDQPNMEGFADSEFTFKVTLRNRTASEQLYSLSSAAPRGWQVRFQSGGQHVTSVPVEGNGTQSIDVEVKPPEGITEGSYTIPITAAASGMEATLELEVVISGSYDLLLTTPDERLNFDITAGREQTIHLQLVNQGTAEIRDITLEAAPPINWEVTFEPDLIEALPPGETVSVQAKVRADRQSLTGDYMLDIEAKSPEVTSTASFRATVKTPTLWGLVGVIIIAGVIIGIGYLFKKYGRR